MHPVLAAEAASEHTIQPRENRRALRQMARRVAIFGAVEDGPQFHAALHDLSRRGLRVRSDTNIACGQSVTIDADVSADLQPLTCRVVRVQLIEAGGRNLFEYGLQIDEASREHGHRWFLYFCYGGITRHPPPEV
ncbi:MAG TPA: PilZ domain-containing protein [Chthonomonadaceae bacterium]|nr:PilZ domain-containing protein [Chthonomonadaceae bacterium]